MSELATTNTGAEYRIERPTMRVVLGDMRVPRTDPGPGDRLPPFELPTIAGGRIDNRDLRRDGRPVLLVFGSRSCPVTESAGRGAHRDTWRAAPPFGAMIAMSRLFGFLAPDQRGRATMALTVGLVLAAVAVAALVV